jgi:hypothetical protein
MFKRAKENQYHDRDGTFLPIKIGQLFGDIVWALHSPQSDNAMSIQVKF